MFKIGDKVICIEDGDYSDLKEGKIYTIENWHGNNMYSIKGVSGWLYSWRFKRLIKTEVDWLNAIQENMKEN